MLCVACGTENPADKRFCRECGSPLAQGCPSCGSPVEPGSRFCGDCGAVLAAPAGAATTPSRRRQLSPLSCPSPNDACARSCSATWSASRRCPSRGTRRRSASCCRLLRRAPGRCRPLRRRGREVHRRRRDGGLGHAGRARRATPSGRCGRRWTWSTRCTSSGARSGAPAWRAGRRGDRRGGGDGRRDQRRHGRGRRRQHRRPGAGGGRARARSGSTARPGGSAPAPSASRTRASTPSRARPSRSSCGGRPGRLRTSGGRNGSTGSRHRSPAGTPRCALIGSCSMRGRAARPAAGRRLGAAGVGKSRLGWEFEKYVDGLVEHELVAPRPVPVLRRGRGVLGAGRDGPAAARHRRGRPARDRRHQAGEGLERYVPDDDRAAYVGTRLAAAARRPVAGDTGRRWPREELFAGWRIFFERLAAHDPVVLLIEDAPARRHELLDFLDHLVDWARTCRSSCWCSPGPRSNSAGRASAPDATGCCSRSTRSTTASMRPLVDALVPGMPDDARDAIVERAQGIPLYAVESVRALIDRDVVQPIEGVYRLVGDIGELDVPDSLHALLAARLDVLDAVLVMWSPTPPCSARASRPKRSSPCPGSNRTRCARILAELLRREVLEVSADPLSPERGSYRFAQEMLRQVAYETLSRRDRKARHLAVAAHSGVRFPTTARRSSTSSPGTTWTPWTQYPTTPTRQHPREASRRSRARAERAERSGAPGRAADSFRLGGSARGERRGRARTQRDAAVRAWGRGPTWLPGTGRPRWSMPNGPVSSMSSSATPAAPALGRVPDGPSAPSGRSAHRGRQGANPSPRGAAGATDADTVAALANLAGVERSSLAR